MSESYKSAGVDVEAGYEAVKLMKQHVSKTFIPGVLSDIGGFGGLFEIEKLNYDRPVLVSGTDGVGTKLKIAFIMDKHDTVGQDCVAMCVNDIACSGARPLFFLDYVAVGKNRPEKVAQIVKGVADGCVQAGCALIGGETAEMPGFYPDGEYDLAGFSVGIVDKNKIIDGSRTKKGDVLIGLASSGIHSNGYSLVRKLFNLNGNEDDKKLARYIEALGCTVGEELLKPTRIYVKTLLDLIEKFSVNAVSHITGGGFIENIPRMLPDGLRAKINKGSWEVLPIFKLLQDLGNISERDMYNTFNMGIGMLMAVEASQADEMLKYLKDKQENAFIIGEIIEGDNGVDIC
ncbi:phosphoribosylformylglycinamidine cyclo-ligase [Petroclostridium sp. X23]|uniref:phosphoribosylformylglycinamidine cyclo-ligase n=1 Tax=Petroclostridium sp. X23 TaxID=3045146 RepID=UPI0024ADEFE4|nr:phosphoribosylformylglycinamidine cyclo-ligase [Petroclostridium sp. X23]WHH58186.1 phosphoribosylformylglycinamidine cyclo-ligase [Petroclostridium sp. X23]